MYLRVHRVMELWYDTMIARRARTAGAASTR